MIDQIFRMGAKQYCSKTDWDIDELREDLSYSDPNDDAWWDDAKQYFEGMRGEY